MTRRTTASPPDVAVARRRRRWAATAGPVTGSASIIPPGIADRAASSHRVDRETAWGDPMIKVTVLYNLPPGADEAAFLRWRTGEHQAANAAAPGVLRADFYRVFGTPQVGPDRPAGDAPYRFVTESYWPDLAAFRAAWDDPAEQARIVAGVGRIADALFLVSEEIRAFVVPEPAP